MAKKESTGLIFNLITMFGALRWLVSSWPRVIAIFTGGIILIDVSAIVIPSEYLVALAATALIMSVLFGYWISLWLHEKAVDNKLANGTIRSRNDLPFDKYYIACSVIGSVVGGVIAAFATPVIAQNYVIGGGMWTYVAICAVLAPILVIGFVCLFHWGIRLFVVRAKEYKYILKEAGEDITEGLTDAQKQAVMNFINSFGVKKQ